MPGRHGVGVGDDVAVGDGVTVAVSVGVPVAVCVGDGVALGSRVGVSVGVSVFVGVGVGLRPTPTDIVDCPCGTNSTSSGGWMAYTSRVRNWSTRHANRSCTNGTL